MWVITSQITYLGVTNVTLNKWHIDISLPMGYTWLCERAQISMYKLTIAHHGSSLPDGSYGGAPCGLLLTAEEKKIYLAGDTALSYSMRLIGEEGIDLAILPIGDNFTMGPDDALRAINLIKPRAVIPVHYDTFDVIAQDPHAWAKRVRAETPAKPVVLSPGESYEL